MKEKSLSALSTECIYPTPKEIFLLLISVRGWVEPQGHKAAWRITSMKISNDIIRNRIRNLPSVNIYVSEFSQLLKNQFSVLYMTKQPSSLCHTFRYGSHSHSDRVCTKSGKTFQTASRLLKPRVVRNARCISGTDSGMLLIPVYNVPVDATCNTAVQLWVVIDC